MGGHSSKVVTVPGGSQLDANKYSSDTSPEANKCSPDTHPDAATHSRLHKGPILSLCALGPDSLLSGGTDKEVNLYHWKHGNHQAKFCGPVKDVTKICYNNTCSFVYAASRDRSLYGWKWSPHEDGECSMHASLQTHEPTTTLQGHSLGVTALDTSDEYPQLLCSGSRDNSVCLWDLDVGKPVSSMYAPRNLVTDLKWIGNEKAVIQASEDKTLRVWDLTSCTTVQHFRARSYLQTCCSVSSNHQQFLSGSSGSGNLGSEVTLWDRRNEKKPLQILKGHSESVESCMFYSYAKKDVACSAGKDSTIRLWELDSGQELCSQLLSNSGSLTAITSPEEQVLACSSFSGGISLWSLPDVSDVDGAWKLTSKQKYF